MNWLELAVAAPFVGFVLLAVLRDGLLKPKCAGALGSFAILVSAFACFMSALEFNGQPQGLTIWQWFAVGNFQADFGFYYDGLTLTMTSIITGVGFLIHLFSTWYMKNEEGMARFFSYMNLFVGFMLILVLADNYLLLYLGWEGVGLCSYLLIGFYYKERKNGAAAIKAFTITRIGDVFLAIGLFLIYYNTGTLNIQAVNQNVTEFFVAGALLVNVTTAMLMLGAFGKSAQLPLQTWLADAMAGPTPISALIHAATMVTAGVYLIARNHELFEAAPAILYCVGVVGTLTLLLAGFVALRQYDIKKILAYSTMSQLGYMFLALGIGAYDASIRHLMVHAFFKALLFLSAGAVIIALHHEQDIRKMGGLWKKIPFVYVCFACGAMALAALPWISAGFYTKDDILWKAFATGNTGFFIAGLVGAITTVLYTFRVFYITFHGPEHGKVHAIKGVNYQLPLLVLALLSTFLGGLIYPPLARVFPKFAISETMESYHHAIEALTIICTLFALVVAIWWFTRKDRVPEMTGINRTFGEKTLANAFGFDLFYHFIFVRPFLWTAHLLRRDPIARLWNGLISVCNHLFTFNKKLQTGYIRSYAMSFAAGLFIILFILIFVN